MNIDDPKTDPENSTSLDDEMRPTPSRVGDIKDISDEDLDKVYKLLNDHNKNVTNDCAVYIIDVTGKHNVYFTFWRERLKAIDGTPMPLNNPFIKNPMYLGNLTTNLVTSVEKALSRKSVENTKVEIGNDSTMVGLIGKTRTEKQEEIVFTFGKHRGETYGQVYMEDPSYFPWLVKNVDLRHVTSKKFEAQVEFAKMYFADVTKKNQETSKSQHVGQMKDKFQGKLRVYAEPSRKQGSFGDYTVYKLIDDSENKFIATDLEKHFPEIKKDSVIDITAKIKGHKELMGIKFTLLNYVRPEKKETTMDKINEVKKVIKQCILEIIDGDENDYPNASAYGKHKYDLMHQSPDYIKISMLEKAINRLPRKIGHKSVSANFQDDSKPFTSKNPMVLVVFQDGANLRKVYLTLKDFNVNGGVFIFVKEGTPKGKTIDIPKFSGRALTIEEITKEILTWMKQ